MKLSNKSKLWATSVLAASLAFITLSVPAQAQTNPNRQVDPNRRVETVKVEEDSDWSWLGLLGLLGLGGLAGRKRKESTTEYVPTSREYINK